jgi:hypothetical protein
MDGIQRIPAICGPGSDGELLGKLGIQNEKNKKLC